MDTNINFDSEQSQRLFELLKGKIPDLPPKYLSKKLSITSHGYIEDGLAEAKELVVNYNNPVLYSYEDWEKDVIGVQQVIEGDSTIYVNLNHFVKYLPDGGLFYHTFYRIKYHAEIYPQDLLKIKAIQTGYVTGLAEQLYNELVETLEKTIKAQPDPELKVKILKRHQVAVNFILENEELPSDKKTQETLNELPRLNWRWMSTYGHEKKHRWDTPYIIKFSHDELINEYKRYKRLISNPEEYQPNASWVRFSYLGHSIHSVESVMLAYYKFRVFLFSEHVNQHPLTTSIKSPNKQWAPDPTEARRILTRFDTYLDSVAIGEAGKQNPLPLGTITQKAIGKMRDDTSIGIDEKQLTRYVKSLYQKTAKEYARHYVRQNFKDKIKGIS